MCNAVAGDEVDKSFQRKAADTEMLVAQERLFCAIEKKKQTGSSDRSFFCGPSATHQIANDK